MTDTDTAAAMRRVIAFVNTRDIDAGSDDIATPEQLWTWLRDQDLASTDARPSSKDLEAAHQLREGLRTALLAHDSHRAAAPLSIRTTVPLQLVISADGGVALEAIEDGVAAAMAALVAPIPAAVGDGSWERTKVCPKDTCQWAFFDQSRNRSRRWCSMEVCGNQEKSKSFRQRQRADD